MQKEDAVQQAQKKQFIKANLILKEVKLDPKLYTIFRLDGHKFSKFVRAFKMQKPFDKNFTQAMKNTALLNFTYFKFQFGFVGSDQISYCMKPLSQENMKKGGTLQFDGRIEKWCLYWRRKFQQHFFIELTKMYGFEKTKQFQPHFDCRVFQVETFEQALENIRQRTVFTLKNSRMMLAQHYFNQKQLNNVASKAAVQKLKQQKGIIYEEIVPKDNQFGTFIFNKKVQQTKEITVKGDQKVITFERKTAQTRNLTPSQFGDIKKQQIELTEVEKQNVQEKQNLQENEKENEHNI